MRWLLLFAAAAAGCSSAAAAPSAPRRRAVLVELYTSQGCSSCPSADAFVRELPAIALGRDRVVPLTFHVDYWDRLGWKDPFASNAFTKRQEWYAAARLQPPDGAAAPDGLYTPQMIVDGVYQFSGGRRRTALLAMQTAAARPPAFDLVVRMTLNRATVDLLIETTPLGEVRRQRDWRLVAALTATRARTAVAHGENAGETLEEAAVVRAMSDRLPISTQRGWTRAQLTRPADLDWSNTEVVVFVQSETTREIGGVVVAIPRATAAP